MKLVRFEKVTDKNDIKFNFKWKIESFCIAAFRTNRKTCFTKTFGKNYQKSFVPIL